MKSKLLIFILLLLLIVSISCCGLWLYLEQSIDDYPDSYYDFEYNSGSGSNIQTVPTEEAIYHEIPATEIETESETRDITSDETDEKPDITFGDAFIFDNFEITFTDEIEWTTVTNQFSDHYEKDVFSVKISVKNLSSETRSFTSFSYDQYGSKGLKLSNISFYFSNDISSSGQFRSEATLESKMHFLYDGDGDYWLEFHLWSYNQNKKTEVRLPISK